MRVEFTIAFSVSINRRNKETPVCEQRQRGINREREREGRRERECKRECNFCLFTTPVCEQRQRGINRPVSVSINRRICVNKQKKQPNACVWVESHEQVTEQVTEHETINSLICRK